MLLVKSGPPTFSECHEKLALIQIIVICTSFDHLGYEQSKKKQAVVYVLMPERLKEWLRWHWAYTPSFALSRRVRLIIHACCSALCISHLFAFMAPLCRLYDRFSSTGRKKPRFIYSHCVILWRSGVSKVSYSLISPP